MLDTQQVNNHAGFYWELNKQGSFMIKHAPGIVWSWRGPLKLFELCVTLYRDIPGVMPLFLRAGVCETTQ